MSIDPGSNGGVISMSSFSANHSGKSSLSDGFESISTPSEVAQSGRFLESETASPGVHLCRSRVTILSGIWSVLGAEAEIWAA